MICSSSCVWRVWSRLWWTCTRLSSARRTAESCSSWPWPSCPSSWVSLCSQRYWTNSSDSFDWYIWQMYNISICLSGRNVRLPAVWLLCSQWDVFALRSYFWDRLHRLDIRWDKKMPYYLNEITEMIKHWIARQLVMFWNSTSLLSVTFCW